MIWCDALPRFGFVAWVLGALLLALNNTASRLLLRLILGFERLLVDEWLNFDGGHAGRFTVTSLIGIYRWLLSAKAVTFACENSLEGARWLDH